MDHPRRAKVALSSVALVAAFACTPTSRSSNTDPKADLEPSPSPTPLSGGTDAASSGRPARETLYAGTYTTDGGGPEAGLIANFLYVRSWGVDENAGTAWIAYSNTNRVPLTDELVWGVDEIDLVRGDVRRSWKQTVGNADIEAKLTFGMLWPLVNTPSNLARLARIARLTDSPTLGTQVEVSHDGRLAIHHRYGTDRSMGDWLMLRHAADGSLVRRLDEGLLASYSPAFSPDDRHVAYTATIPGNGAEGSGGYGLYVQRLSDDHRTRLEEVGHAGSIWWSPDGQRIWSVGQGRGKDAKRYCARYHELDTGEVTRVVCFDGLDDVRATVSDDGARAVVWGRFDPTGDRRDVLVPIDVRTGTPGDRYEVGGGASPVSLRNDGLLLVNRRTGASFTRFDPETQTLTEHGTLDVSLQGPIRWMPDGSAIGSRTVPDGQGNTEIVIERVWPQRL